MPGIAASLQDTCQQPKGSMGLHTVIYFNNRFGSFYIIVMESIAKAIILEILGFFNLILITKYSVTGGIDHLSSPVN